MTDVSLTFGGFFAPAWGCNPKGRLSERSILRERFSHQSPPCPDNLDTESEMDVGKGAKNFHANSVRSLSTNDFASRIAEALHRQFGYGNGAAKRIAQVTGASAHTCQNWLDGVNAPSGYYLAALIEACEEVTAEFLLMTGHAEKLEALQKAGALEDIRRALAVLEGRP